jgi:hypothetical protein
MQLQQHYIQKVSCVLYIPSAYVNMGCISTAKHNFPAQVQPHNAILAEHAFAFTKNLPLETNQDTEHLNEPYDLVRAPPCKGEPENIIR